MARLATLALALLAWLSPGALLERLAAVVPAVLTVSESPRAVDVVVVFAGGSGERLRRAAQLVESGYARRILFLGNALEKQCARGDLAQWAPDRAAEVTFSAEDLPNTATSARYAVRWLREHGARSAMVVSHGWHLRRVSWLMGRQGADLSYSAVGEAMPARWWASPALRRPVALECLKLATCAILNLV